VTRQVACGRAAASCCALLLAGLILSACGSATGGTQAHDADTTSSAPPHGAPTVPATSSNCDGPGIVSVRTADQLQQAIAAAKPGQTIVLAPGTYSGNFVATSSGTAAEPITLCGGRDSLLNGEDVNHGYVLYLDKASWWQLEGFTIENGQKGLVTDGSSHDLIYGLYVHSIGDEAIHLRSFSSDDIISHCIIRDTGLHTQFFGEGIYVGSAHKNWCRYTNCLPDRSDNNTIAFNNIAHTTAENIDIKEGTTGGIIMHNTLNGAGMVASAATAWINVKGNDWTVEDNTGTYSIGDGFQVHQVYPGWGIGNVFKNNSANVEGPGYGFYVQSRSLRTVITCSNSVRGAVHGLSNISCTSI